MDYRIWAMPDRAALGRPVIAVMSAITLYYLLVVDVWAFAPTLRWYLTAAFRLGLIVAGVLAYRAMANAKSPKTLDWILGSFATYVAGFLFIRHFTVQSSIAHVGSDAAIVMMIYLLPMSLRLQMALGFGLMASTFATFTVGEPWAVAVGPLIIAHGLGITASVALQKRSRQRFEAFQEIRTLRGIIPICASCKNVRDDTGFWGRVESYVSANSDAEFSHGLCPTCLADAMVDM